MQDNAPTNNDKPATNERWYYAEGETVNGPFSFPELLKKAEEGLLNSGTLVVPEGSEDWQPFSAIAPAKPQETKEVPSQEEEPPPISPESEIREQNGDTKKAAPEKANDKFFEAITASSENPAPNNKDALKGCGLIVLLIVAAVILWHHWRLLLTMGGFLGVWYGFTSSNLAAKRSKIYSIGGGFVLGLLTMTLLRSCVGTDGIDLSNPPVALEKLAKEAFSSEAGIERISVDTMGPEQDSYSLNVSYRARSVLGEETTFKHIRLRMQEAYAEILKYPELPISYLKINAQLELKDRYGNTSWDDVYRTQLEMDAIGKLNRKNLDLVDFEKIWDVVFIHPIFWPYDEKKSR